LSSNPNRNPTTSPVDRGSGRQPRQPARPLFSLLSTPHHFHSRPAEVTQPRDQSRKDCGCNCRMFYPVLGAVLYRVSAWSGVPQLPNPEHSLRRLLLARIL